jgi:post-segregation antitoxin (ccd killing protein)
MGRIQTEISEGELLDRISILEIKLNKIKNHTQLKEVKKEYEILNKLKQKHINSSKTIDLLYKDLKEINEKIWIIENEKRLCEKNSDFKEKFIQICRNEYFENDKRAKIKRKINKILDSYIKEVKQHTKY